MGSNEHVLANWQWKQRNPAIVDVLAETDGWHIAQTNPSEVHVELMKAGLIDDPYLGFNEHKIQWVGDVEWLYRTTFTYENHGAHSELIFFGLDTICDVYLNKTKILSSSNQFQTHIVPVDTLRPVNTLFLHFSSAKALAKTLEAQYGRVRAGSTNLGDPSRVYIRKAQYDWRWDWGPELMTCGPYRPIVLKTYDICIEEVFTHAIVEEDGSLTLDVDVNLSGTTSEAQVKISLFGTVETNIEISSGNSVSTISDTSAKVHWTQLEKMGAKKWWPVGYGDPALYDVHIDVTSPTGLILDSQIKRIGFRSIKLVQEELQEADQYGTGTTFLFEVNGVRIFAGGSNWIPADNFLTTLTTDRYRAWLTLLRDGNQNMIRLWGGGIYEPDAFYDICDELGLLVWQDFQFACGVYPAHDSFLQSVRKEAEDNVKRLRHHPCLALLCGNNEDYQMVLQWDDVPYLPATKIYEDILPSLVSALTDPPIPYHRGSPYGGKGWDTADPTIGDVHQWNVWGGKELPYQEYDRMGGRFVSEFGLPSHPNIHTIEYYASNLDEDRKKKEWYPQSRLLAQHNKAGLFERRFAIVMNDNFRVTNDMEIAVFNTQLMQSEGVGFAYQSWRRQWKGRGKEYTSGVLVWQSNDCWPTASWSIADYFLRAKPVYYTIKRNLSPIALGAFRTVTKNRQSDRPRQFYEFGAYQSTGATLDIWGVNGTLVHRTLKLEIHAVDINSDWKHKESMDVVLPPNQSKELLSFPCPCPSEKGLVSPSDFPEWTTSYSIVVGLRLVDSQTGEVVARYADWPQPYRLLDLDEDPKVKVNIGPENEKGECNISVESMRPVKCLVLSARGKGGNVWWSDNALDVIPGDGQRIIAKGLKGRAVEIAYLGNEKATLP